MRNNRAETRGEQSKFITVPCSTKQMLSYENRVYSPSMPVRHETRWLNPDTSSRTCEAEMRTNMAGDMLRVRYWKYVHGICINESDLRVTLVAYLSSDWHCDVHLAGVILAMGTQAYVIQAENTRHQRGIFR